MSSRGDDREDSMLDRMEHIAEVEEEMDDDEEDDEDDSLDPGVVFGSRGSSVETGEDGDEGSSYAGDEEEADDDDEEEDVVSEEESDAATPLEYDWNPSEMSIEGGSTNFQMSAITLEGASNSVLFDSLSEEGSNNSALSSRRGSFTAPRRLSHTRVSFSSPQSQNNSSPTISPGSASKRRLMLSGQSSSDLQEGEFDDERTQRIFGGRAMSRRRQSFAFKPSSTTSTGGSQNEDDNSTSTPNSGRNRFMRKSTRRVSLNAPTKASANMFESMDSAISSLGQGGNAEWQNVAAAAAVVAGTTGKGSSKGPRIQFAVDERVLVFLNILNHTNSVDSRDALTVSPVNKYGYPQGEGKKSHEQEGPHVYVLAVIRKLHFDEDVPYYTVARADTGTEQRADTAWMEPIKSIQGIEAAMRAASQTSREVGPVSPADDDSNPFCSRILKWPAKFLKQVAMPCYTSLRAKTKHHVKLLLFGQSPYTCKIRATGINFLVACSSVYLFLEVVSLSFFPADADFPVAVVGLIVWSVLVLELVLEWLIRSRQYFDLIASDKAYAPSTARNINAFHLAFEFIALALFIPEFLCVFTGECGRRILFSSVGASVSAILGPNRWDAAIGRLVIGLRTLRIFGLVRHWKKMWINNTFRDESSRHGLFYNIFVNMENPDPEPRRFGLKKQRKNKVFDDLQTSEDANVANEEDQRLKKAATIGTALMIVNSHRALFLLCVIITILPVIRTFGGVNRMGPELVDLLQQNNIEAGMSECTFLESSVRAWLQIAGVEYQVGPNVGAFEVYVLWAQVLPIRCAFQEPYGVVTRCADDPYGNTTRSCNVWQNITGNASTVSESFFANQLDVRVGGIREYQRDTIVPINMTNTAFSVRAFVNHNATVSRANFSAFLLMVGMLALCLFGLTVLRADAGRLVLDPLQRMLKIVVRYAQNPLSHTAPRKNRKGRNGDDSGGDGAGGDKEQLGNYETEQLINAISKIADLLRKCWGVAGAGIISTNLARTEDGKTVVFNPTVPGKRVYALFGFVAINGFSAQLRALDRDVMILINDVAKVVHDEVYRWSLGDSGQCNKNLGSAFLMVFRIGDFKEVHERQAKATDVVFNTTKEQKRRNLRQRKKGINHGRSHSTRSIRRGKDRRNNSNDTLQLASLPGIQTFSDRALLGMLKSYAGIHRDKRLQNWKKDFRLGAGVGAYTVNIIIGMDAGWAVEGAVGSEYKIDATYLSPHVNMASRMMSATKQYGVTILLSQAVEELLSRQARSKLRHLDTVFVKGSSVAQRIFTFDARHMGVDFFLFERSAEQADVDAESYNIQIWETDQDLLAMRQHVTEDFERKFKMGKDQYLSGDWKAAIATLQEADDNMITTVLEEGYIDYNPDEIDGRIFDRHATGEEVMRVRHELGDGACKCLVSYMERRGGVPPDNWKGVRPLTSK